MAGSLNKVFLIGSLGVRGLQQGDIGGPSATTGTMRRC